MTLDTGVLFIRPSGETRLELDMQNVMQQLLGMGALVFPIWRQHFYSTCLQEMWL